MFSKNHGFETYKIASIMVSFLSLAAIFYFVKEISGKRLAYITCLILSTAYLHLIWSRLGNSQIAIPLLSALTGYYTVKYLKKKRFRDALLAGVSASSGWYLYPQTFILPFSFFIFYFVLFLFSRKTKSLLEPAIILFLMFLIFLPFLSIVKRQPDNFGPEGYVGQKVIPGFYMKPAEIIKTMLNRYLKIAGMFHLVGDDTFRINVVRKPHLDKISGIFFLAGFIYFLRKKRIKYLIFILWMLISLPLPSISPAIRESEIPNTGRTIALMPYVYTLVAAGFFLLNEISGKLGIKIHLRALLISVLFILTVYLNMRLYFVDYVWGLPDHNLAPGKIIAHYVDSYPKGVGLYFNSCCWGEWGAPDPKGVAYTLRKERFVDFSKQITACQEITYKPVLVMTDPGKPELLEKFKNCFPDSVTLELKHSQRGIISKFVYFK